MLPQKTKPHLETKMVWLPEVDKTMIFGDSFITHIFSQLLKRVFKLVVDVGHLLDYTFERGFDNEVIRFYTR